MIIDSSVWIDLFKGVDGPHVEALMRAVSEGRAMTTDVVRLEVLAGDGPESRTRRLADTLDGCAEAAQRPRTDVEGAAAILRACRRAGETIRSLNDCLIAAIAIRTEVPVLHNDRDFDTIARHTDLQAVRS